MRVRERERLTNLALAALLALAVVTGLTANAAGTSWGRTFVVLHGAVGLALLVLGPRKSRIADRGLRRRRRHVGWHASLVLAGLVIVTVVSGLVATTGVTDRVGPLSLMQVHIGSAVLAVPLAVSHYRGHHVRPRTTDLSRRALLRTGAVAAAAGVSWLSWEGVMRVAGWPGKGRRFTGSHERGSGDPAAMPVTQWLDDTVQQLDASTWRLTVAGAVYTLADLRALPLETFDATLDCTSQWYARQSWHGVRLDRLIDPGDARSIEVRSVTGYPVRLPVRDLDRVWLALEVGGEPLSPGHGFPVRLVAPGRRGFWWVKWVQQVERSPQPWWVQSPFPLT